MHIRRAVKDDISEMLAIEEANFKERAFSRHQFAGYIKYRHVYVVIANDHVAAYCIIFTRKNSKASRIHVISVKPELTGLGIGSFLINHVEKIATISGYCAMVLEVNADNKGAINMYAKRGYNLERYLFNYYGHGTVGLRMIKRLI